VVYTIDREFKIKRKSFIYRVLFIIIVGWGIFPEQLIIPVKNAKKMDWNHNTFWYAPWGQSGVHKGIDIFAPKNTDVLAATGGLVLYKGQFKLGGNVLVVLGPKWRLHYYAHLNESAVFIGKIVFTAEKIATIGDTGNARGKPYHLHYTVLSLLPYFWRWDHEVQGWKKMFYLNPSDLLSR